MGASAKTGPRGVAAFLQQVLPPLSVVALALLLWEYVIPLGVVPGVRPEYLGTPSGIWAAAVELADKGYGGRGLLEHVRASLFRTVTGFAIAAAEEAGADRSEEHTSELQSQR